MNRTTLWPVVIVISALGIGLLAGFDSDSPVRPIVTMWFLLVCTGMAFVRLLDIKDYLIEFVLGVTLSITMTTIVSEMLVLSKTWEPTKGLFILIGISMVGVILQIFLLFRQHQSGEPASEVHEPDTAQQVQDM